MTRKSLEFKKAVKLELLQRAGGPEAPRCEKCYAAVRGKRFEYDHTVEIWELPTELREAFLKDGVPAEYGQLLCGLCHDEKSGKKTSERAHGKRIQAKAAKATKTSRPMPGSRASKWRKRVDGTVERR